MSIELKGNNYYSRVFKRVNYKLQNNMFWVVIMTLLGSEFICILWIGHLYILTTFLSTFFFFFSFFFLLYWINTRRERYKDLLALIFSSLPLACDELDDSIYREIWWTWNLLEYTELKLVATNYRSRQFSYCQK